MFIIHSNENEYYYEKDTNNLNIRAKINNLISNSVSLQIIGYSLFYSPSNWEQVGDAYGMSAMTQPSETSICGNSRIWACMKQEFTTSNNYIIEFDITKTRNRAGIGIGKYNHNSPLETNAYKLFVDVSNCQLWQGYYNENGNLVNRVIQTLSNSVLGFSGTKHCIITRHGNKGTMSLNGWESGELDFTGTTNVLNLCKWNDGYITLSNIKVTIL